MSNIRTAFTNDVMTEFYRKCKQYTRYQAMGMTLMESKNLLTSAELALVTGTMLGVIERGEV